MREWLLWRGPPMPPCMMDPTPAVTGPLVANVYMTLLHRTSVTYDPASIWPPSQMREGACAADTACSTCCSASTAGEEGWREAGGSLGDALALTQQQKTSTCTSGLECTTAGIGRPPAGAASTDALEQHGVLDVSLLQGVCYRAFVCEIVCESLVTHELSE